MKQQRSSKIYNDDLWRTIILDPIATALIDTKEFQRLDKIRQLGFSYYVYRGAKHSRLEHSIGVYHVTKKIFDHIERNHERLGIDFPYDELSDKFGKTPHEKLDNVKKVVSLAGLLHDLTHVPFGHSLEDEFDMYIKHDAIQSMRLWWMLFDENSEIRKKVISSNNGTKIGGFNNIELFQLIFVILKYKVLITGKKREDFKTMILNELEKLSMKEMQTIQESLEKLYLKKDIIFSEIPIDLNAFYKKKDIHDTIGEIEEGKVETYVQLTLLYLWYMNFKDDRIFHPFMADAFANTLCADILDYVPRDALNCGLSLKYNPRIFDYFYLGQDSLSKELRLSIAILDKRGMRRDDIYEIIIDLMRSRFTLAQAVYYHKTKTVVTNMLIRVLRNLKDDIPTDTNPYTDKNSIIFLGDEELFFILERKVKEKMSKIKPSTIEFYELKESEKFLQQIKDGRVLYKVGVILSQDIFEKHQLTPYIDTITGKYNNKNYKQREKDIKDLETMILREFKDKITHIISYCPPSHSSAKEIATFVQIQNNGECTPLNQYAGEKKGIIQNEIELISTEKYKSLWKFYIFVSNDVIENEILLTKLINSCLENVLQNIGCPDKFDRIRIDPTLITAEGYIKEDLKNYLLVEWFKEDTVLNPPDIKEQIQNRVNLLDDKSFFSKDEYYNAFEKIWNDVVISYNREIEQYIHDNKNLVKDEIKEALSTSVQHRDQSKSPTQNFINALKETSTKLSKRSKDD